MCGIAALLTSANLPKLPGWPFWSGTNSRNSSADSPVPTLKALLPLLQNRGPHGVTIQTARLDPSTNLQAVSTLLSLRPSPSEHVSIAENLKELLLFNGEIYDLPEETSDTERIHDLVTALPSDQPLLPSHLDFLRGPWSIIVWRPHEQRLYFARDILGRRSLMLCALPGFLAVSSIIDHPDCVEIPPVGVCYLDLSSRKFGIYPRPVRMVLPMRMTDRCDDNKERDTYISYLPSSWLRSSDRIDFINIPSEQSVTDFLTYFRKSTQRRLATKQLPCSTKPRYAILFSGGVDSLLIAAILDKLLPEGEPLHLINVAFGENRTALAACPDRVTAIQGAEEIRALSRGREIALICVDVKPDEADQVLEKRVRSLVYPCDKPMDASIGTAIWMAAQGKGYIHSSKDEAGANRKEVTSTARILFSGLGADELMGGYKGRHRTTYRRYGVPGIAREMDADLSRLWFRNLGRDDRLIADHGKEVRHPFLDEDLITYVTSLPLVEHVCDLSQPDGVGDKHLLRRALRHIGFSEEAVRRGKRAIQFGSRSKQVVERRREVCQENQTVRLNDRTGGLS